MPSDFKRTVCEDRTGFIVVAFALLPATVEKLSKKIDSDSFNDEFGTVLPTLAKETCTIGFTVLAADLKAKWRGKSPEQIAEGLLKKLKTML